MSDTLNYLDIAARLTASNNIDILIDAANKIRNFHTGQHSDPGIPTEIVAFSERLAAQHPTLGSIPFVPYGFQRKILTGLALPTNTVLVTGRQLGSTMMVGTLAAFSAISKPDQTIVLCHDRLSSAIDALDRIARSIEGGFTVRSQITSRNKCELRFRNGSRIFTAAASADVLRGRRVDLLIVDCAAFISYATLTKLLQSALNAKIVLASTPRLAEGPFFAATRDPKFQTIKTIWRDHPNRDQTWAQNARSQMGQEAFLREHEAEFTQCL